MTRGEGRHSTADGRTADTGVATGGIGHLGRRLTQAHARLWQRAVSAEVTGPQYTVLALLQQHGSLDQKTLGTLVHLDKSTLAPLLERLRAKGLLEIGSDPGDRRRKLLRATPAGRRLVTELTPAATALDDRLRAAFPSPAAAARFTTALHRLVEAAEQE